MNKIREVLSDLIDVVDHFNKWSGGIPEVTLNRAKAALAAEPPCKTEGVTVREAFALAGHPVPDGARIHLYDWDGDGERWHYHTADTRFYWRKYPVSGYVQEWVAGGGFLNNYKIDFSNLPAKDACFALPECVRAATAPPTEDRAEGDTR